MSEHYAKALQTIELLSDLFPLAFRVYAAARLPLKVGIFQDLLDTGLFTDHEPDLRSALRRYTGCSPYQRKLKVGASRFDLAGNAVGEVTEHQARGATAFLTYLAGRAAEKAKAAQPQPLEAPRRLSLGDLRAAAQARKAATSGAAK
jgi:ProP effector